MLSCLAIVLVGILSPEPFCLGIGVIWPLLQSGPDDKVVSGKHPVLAPIVLLSFLSSIDTLFLRAGLS